MVLTRATRLFLDAATLFAAAHSPRGGSAFLLLVCAKGYLRAVVSPDVLLEAERNLANKSTQAALARYHRLIATVSLELALPPTAAAVSRQQALFREDAHVVAAALSAQVAYIVTLDRILQARLAQAQLPFIGISPRDFIQHELPGHPDYPGIRQLGDD